MKPLMPNDEKWQKGTKVVFNRDYNKNHSYVTRRCPKGTKARLTGRNDISGNPIIALEREYGAKDICTYWGHLDFIARVKVGDEVLNILPNNNCGMLMTIETVGDSGSITVKESISLYSNTSFLAVGDRVKLSKEGIKQWGRKKANTFATVISLRQASNSHMPIKIKYDGDGIVRWCHIDKDRKDLELVLDEAKKTEDFTSYEECPKPFKTTSKKENKTMGRHDEARNIREVLIPNCEDTIAEQTEKKYDLIVEAKLLTDYTTTKAEYRGLLTIVLDPKISAEKRADTLALMASRGHSINNISIS